MAEKKRDSLLWVGGLQGKIPISPDWQSWGGLANRKKKVGGDWGGKFQRSVEKKVQSGKP